VRWEIKLSLDDKLSQKYSYRKLLKSDNPSSRYSRKCQGCFLGHSVVWLIGAVVRLLDIWQVQLFAGASNGLQLNVPWFR